MRSAPASNRTRHVGSVTCARYRHVADDKSGLNATKVMNQATNLKLELSSRLMLSQQLRIALAVNRTHHI